MRMAGIVSAILVSATAAIAQAPTETPSTQTVDQSDQDQVVCRRVEQIGSRISARRVCRTRAQWAEEQDESRKVIERIQSMKPLTGN